jgi:imidazolonepropionase-like amidohydrolase
MTQVLRGGAVFDAATGTTRFADVVLEGDIISAIEDPSSRLGDAADVDVSGMTVLPGLINLHAHLLERRVWGPKHRQWQLKDVYHTIRGVRSSMAVLQQGFTTIRELAAQHALNLDLKRAIEVGMFPGPRVLAAGAPISVTGGHAWPISIEADGPIGMRRAVRESIKQGVDWIKLLSSNDPVPEQPDGQYSHPEFAADEYVAAVETAHLWGRPVTAHTMGRQSIEWAIAAGVDCMEHGIYMDPELAASRVAANIALVPTLSGYHQNTLDVWGRDPSRTALMKKLVKPHHHDSVRHAVKAGVRIGLGTDSTGDHVEELEMLVECGMSPGQALRSATLDAACILRLDDRLGSIGVGKIADLVVVRGDPLVDLQCMRAVEWVFQSGYGRRPCDIVMPTMDETADWNALGLL